MFGQFTREKEPDGGLGTGDGGPLVVAGQLGSLGSDTLKEIIGPRVHDAHGLKGDTSVGMEFLQHLVDVDDVGLLALGFVLLAILGNNFSGLGSLGWDIASRITLSRKSLKTPQVSLWIKPSSNVFSQDFLSSLKFIFWEGHKILQNLHLTVVLCSASQK